MIRKRDIRDFLLLCFLIYPAFRFMGFEMFLLDTTTPSYIRIWAVISLVISVFLCFKTKIISKMNINIKLYVCFAFIVSIINWMIGKKVAVTSLFIFISTFFTCYYFFYTKGMRAIDFFYHFFNILIFIEVFSLIRPLRTFFNFTSLQTFIGHIQIYSMMWLLYVVLLLYKWAGIKHTKYSFLTKLYMILIFIITSLLTLYSGTITAKMVMIIFPVIYLLFRSKTINSKKVLIVLFIITIFLNGLIIFANFQNILSSFFIRIGEDSSLNGRTYVWSLFLPKIFSSPIFGYGYKALTVQLSKWGHTNDMYYCHNTLLQELAHGGFIQLILFILVNFAAIKNLGTLQDKRIKHILFCAFIVFCLIMIPESITCYNYFSVFLVLLLSGQQIELDEEKEQELV